MTRIASAEEVHHYWFETLEAKNWYVADDTVDQTIVERFASTWETALNGGLQDWRVDPQGVLSYLIVTDQFPRNMFRGDGRSFATDHLALKASRDAIVQDWDLQIPEPARQFFYTAFMHSEDLDAQDAGIRHVEKRMPETGHNTIDHSRAHRWVIAEFGRFPYRNPALGRETSPDEQHFLDAGGYGYALDLVRRPI